MYQWIFVFVFMAGPENKYVAGPFSTAIECEQHYHATYMDIDRHWRRSKEKFVWGTLGCERRSVARHRKVSRHEQREHT